MHASATILLTAALFAQAQAAAPASCSRPIVVPMAPIGVSVVVEGERLQGIYPRLLDRISDRTGCIFKTSVVPQARLEVLFANGVADVFAPAIQTSRRDQMGVFVPLLETRAMLLSFDKRYPAIRNLNELLRTKALRVVIVRGNDYGETYQAAIATLERQGRLYKEADPEHVARLLAAGMADVALLTPMSLVHAIKSDPRTVPYLGRLQLAPIQELGWRASGVYLSRSALSAADRDLLAAQLRENFRADEVWDQFRRYYPAEVLNLSARRR